jgi:hypothetical protein
MPRGPRGEKRPTDVFRAAVMVAKIATGEVEEKTRNPGTEYARKGGLKDVTPLHQRSQVLARAC